MSLGNWRVRLSEPAEQDFEAILRWTRGTFGPLQARAYGNVLVEALVALASGPNPVGSANRDDILPGLRSLHVSRGGRRGRHFILYRVPEPNLIEVVRILHDAMDIGRYVSREE